jgi:hypothetical protein
LPPVGTIPHRGVERRRTTLPLRPGLIIEVVNLERFDSSRADTVTHYRLIVLIKLPPEKEFDIAALHIGG